MIYLSHGWYAFDWKAFLLVFALVRDMRVIKKSEYIRAMSKLSLIISFHREQIFSKKLLWYHQIWYGVYSDPGGNILSDISGEN